MKSIPYLGVIFVVIFALCTSKPYINSDIIPSETIEIKISDESCASIISRDLEITLQYIKDDVFKNILKNKSFRNKKSRFELLHMPKLNFFKLAIENMGDVPLRIGEAKISYDNVISRQLSAEYLKDKYDSGFSSVVNFEELLSLFKLETDELCTQDIDYKLDIVKYANYEIQPGEKALQIIVFDWIPVQIRNFTLSVEIKSGISQKIIDFRLMRFEYRQSGKYYIKPEKTENY